MNDWILMGFIAVVIVGAIRVIMYRHEKDFFLSVYSLLASIGIKIVSIICIYAAFNFIFENFGVRVLVDALMYAVMAAIVILIGIWIMRMEKK